MNLPYPHWFVRPVEKGWQVEFVNLVNEQVERKPVEKYSALIPAINSVRGGAFPVYRGVKEGDSLRRVR